MSGVPIDYVRVLVAAVAQHLLGGLVFAASGLGQRWYLGHRNAPPASASTPAKSTRSKTTADAVRKGHHPLFVQVTSFLTGLVTAYVAAHVLIFAQQYFKISGIQSGLQAGFWNFIGFDLTLLVWHAIWLDTELFSVGLDLFYHLAKELLIGVILTAPLPF